MRFGLRAHVVATVVIGLVLGGVGYAVAESPEQRAEVRAATRVAEAYEARLDRYAADTAEAIRTQHDKDADGYVALLEVVEKRRAKAPQPPRDGTTAYGREHSGAYRGAAKLRTVALSQFDLLAAYLRDVAIPTSAFIRAGKKLVKLSPATLLGDTPIVSGAPLRDLVLPPYRSAARRLDKVEVPDDAKLLALDLTTYGKDVISSTKDGADAIDEGKPFFFNIQERATGLFKRLLQFETVIQNNVSEQVDSVAVAP